MAKKTIPKKIGKGLALFQSFVDDCLDAGFKRMKSFGKEAKKNEEEGDIKRGLKRVAHFLGDAGEAFYKEYEKIKSKKGKK